MRLFISECAAEKGSSLVAAAEPLALFPCSSGAVFRSSIRFSSNPNEVLWNPMFWGGEGQRLNLDDLIVLESSPTGLRRVDAVAVPGLSFPLRTSHRLHSENRR
jgi:hypothetical protein